MTEVSEHCAWKKDEAAFLKHFDLPYADFANLILCLTEKQREKYDKICAVNEEAAVLWAIHEGKSHGILEEKSVAEVTPSQVE